MTTTIGMAKTESDILQPINDNNNGNEPQAGYSRTSNWHCININQPASNLSKSNILQPIDNNDDYNNESRDSCGSTNNGCPMDTNQLVSNVSELQPIDNNDNELQAGCSGTRKDCFININQLTPSDALDSSSDQVGFFARKKRDLLSDDKKTSDSISKKTIQASQKTADKNLIPNEISIVIKSSSQQDSGSLTSGHDSISKVTNKNIKQNHITSYFKRKSSLTDQPVNSSFGDERQKILTNSRDNKNNDDRQICGQETQSNFDSLVLNSSPKKLSGDEHEYLIVELNPADFDDQIPHDLIANGIITID